MKYKILKLGFFLALFNFVGTACVNVDVKPTKLEEQEFWKFSDFGCENHTWNLNPGYVNNHYVVETQDALKKYIQGDCTPQIDFNKYFVIIGSKSFSTGASLLVEKVEENNVEIVYTVTFLTDLTQVAVGVKYHIVLKKPSSKKEIKVVEVVKNQI
ncbi:MAG: hypothetical protein J7L04_06120 [Bacteroidales bacterium]|nr:hypothetical protein [Bacteroidales bacterium]